MADRPLPQQPGWYIHDSLSTGRNVYRVALERPSREPDAAPFVIVYAGGHKYQAGELRGLWYGPLDLAALIQGLQAPGASEPTD